MFKVESPDVLPNTEKATIEKDVSEAMTSNFRAHSMVAKYHEGDVDSDDEGPEDDGSDDDIGHLEHAWEMLEMARMIWSKAGKVDLACEAIHSLGEVRYILLDICVLSNISRYICVIKHFKVSMEGHNYEQAIADFEDCLSKRTAALPAGSRLGSLFFSSSSSSSSSARSLIKSWITHAGLLLRPTTGLALLWLMWTTGLVLRQLSTKPWR